MKSWGASLGPLTKATDDAPGPTLWARCEAIEIGAVYIRGEVPSQDSAARMQSRIHAKFW